jgi:hypothetical protein
MNVNIMGPTNVKLIMCLQRSIFNYTFFATLKQMVENLGVSPKIL